MDPARASGGATLGDLIRDAAYTLSGATVESPRRQAEALLEWLLGWDRARLLARDREPAPPGLQPRLRELARRRAAGEPLQYLTGVQEFWSMPFRVDPRVLIPRPETEGLVEECLRLLPAPEARVVDVGTGSGCIAAALARERPGWRILATDLSPSALSLARENFRALVPGASIDLVRGDLLEPIRPGAGLDLIVSNPPYIADGERPGLPREVLREPAGALFAGDTGLHRIEALLAAAPRILRPGGWLVLEVGHGQWPAVRRSLEAAGGWTSIGCRRDFQGIDRVVSARAADA